MLHKIKITSLSLAIISSLTIFSGCGDIDNTGENIVGNNFVSAEVIDDINASTMLSIIKAKIDSNAINAFGYKAIKITYNTKGQNDKDIVASGLLVIPTATPAYQEYLKSAGKSFSVSMICDNHGTILTNAEAPSNVEVKDGMPNYPLAISMTGYAGFAGIYPDYIGYGDSNNETHPYLLKKASARASLDMIKASQRYMTDNGIIFNSQLFLSGYSEGGYTTLALAEEIEENHSKEFNLLGVAPMAGPYFIDSMGDSIIKSDSNMSVPAYVAFLIDSYTNAYDNLSLNEIVVDNKISAFNGLFDGNNSLTDILTKLGMGLNTPTNKLIKDSFISDYESSSEHKLKTIFKENNVGNWLATSKIKLIHCSNDDVVPVDMTNGVEYTLNTLGATNIEKYIINGITADYEKGESIHSNCASPAYKEAIGWFDAIRKGEIK